MVLSDFSDTALLIVIHYWGWESLCEIPMRCPTVIIQEFYSNMHGFDTSIPRFATQIRGTRIVVTLEIVFEILHIQWVLYPNYLACLCLRTVSKDELLSLFCETPSLWGECQNTSCSSFAKGPSLVFYDFSRTSFVCCGFVMDC